MKVFFEPWIGKDYNSSEKRILVIGDSHYCGECERCGVRGNCSLDEMGKECHEFTRKVVKEYIAYRNKIGEKKNWMKRTFYPFDKIYYGKDNISSEESESLWYSVAFYNFLQTAGSTEASNTNYRNEEYARSASMAWDVICKLRPDFVIVWGNKAYKYLPSERWTNGIDDDNGVYTLDDGHIVHCIRIYHPSRANVQYWHDILYNFLKQ